MTRIEGQPVLSVAAMRAAEDRAIAAGASVESLMERAGAGVAEAVHRLAAGAPVLVLCGPGNNGGDGYVAARMLRANGVAVRVAAFGEPGTDPAVAARRRWDGPVATFHDPLVDDAVLDPVVVDAVFGTGLSRAIDTDTMMTITSLAASARLSIAVDLPSGVNADSGTEPSHAAIADFSVTLALGALKPAHLLQPSAARCGMIRVLDIGLPALDRSRQLVERLVHDWSVERPTGMADPGPSAHKYSRGMVVVIGGAMPGAAALAAGAAMHAGAGYTLLFGHSSGAAHALVQRPWSRQAFSEALKGKRPATTAVVVGPGLGAGADAAEKLHTALESAMPLVIDGDALRMLGQDDFDRIASRPTGAPVILTPHAGEFEKLFGAYEGSKLDAARAAARRSGAVVVFKGPDTVVAYPDGTTATSGTGSPWLSTAGTGDVLAGTIAAALATRACCPAEDGVWMHAEAARRLGPAFIADDLVRQLSAVRAALARPGR